MRLNPLSVAHVKSFLVFLLSCQSVQFVSISVTDIEASGRNCHFPIGIPALVCLEQVTVCLAGCGLGPHTEEFPKREDSLWLRAAGNVPWDMSVRSHECTDRRMDVHTHTHTDTQTQTHTHTHTLASRSAARSADRLCVMRA